MNKKTLIIIVSVVILLILVIIGIVLVINNFQTKNNLSQVNNFVDCQNKGYAIMETYPRQCQDPNTGKTYTEEIQTTCEDQCGDGVCSEITCQAIGCPCSESAETCPNDCGNNGTELANPASTNCVNNEGKVDIRTNTVTGGQIGFCVFPDKSECEEWALFRNECEKGQCLQECRNVGSKSEGYYNSCTDALIKWVKCQ